MSTRWIVAALAVAPVLAAGRASAQTDTQLWAEGGVGYGLGDRLSLVGTLLLRMGEDASRVVAIMPEVELRYRVTDWLRVGPGYRLERELTGSGDFETRHRLFADANLRRDAGRVRLGYRARLQEQFRKNGDRTIWRNKVGASWRGSRPWQPGASVELFHDLADGTMVKWRLTIGTEYALKPGRDVELYYRYEDPDDPLDPELHIIGIGFQQAL
jgi:hypothetical protein